MTKPADVAQIFHAESELLFGEERDSRLGTRVVPVPVWRLSESRLITGSESDLAVDAYRVLRTRVWKAVSRNQWRVVGVTSARGGEGKTLTTTNLGIALAMRGTCTAVLIDADLRKPSVLGLFGLQPVSSLNAYLAGEATTDDVLVSPGISGFAFIPSYPAAHASELLASELMGELIADLKARRNDTIILVDLPPVLVGDDVITAAEWLDAIVLVAEEGRTLVDDLHRVIDLLRDVNLIGVALNKSREHIKEYGYYGK